MLRDEAHVASSTRSTTLPNLEPTALPHLEKLTSLSLSTIQTLPTSLAKEADSIQASLSSLCLRHSNAFVRVHVAEESLRPALESVSETLDSHLDTHIPHLNQRVQHFDSHADEPLDRRRQAASLMEDYENDLTSLLETPKLIATCVAARRPEEAVALANHFAATVSALRVATEDTDSECEAALWAICSLVSEVETSISVLQRQLVASWRTASIKLPNAKRTLSQLRSLSTVARHLDSGTSVALDDTQLCLAFLQARIVLFRSRLESATTVSDASGLPVKITAEVLQKYCDAWREGVMDVLGISTALFKEADSGRPHSPSIQSLIAAAGEYCIERLTSTLASYLPHYVAAFEAHPTEELGHEIARHLSDLHRQLRYASIACSRFGLNFAVKLNSTHDEPNTAAGVALAVFRAALTSAASKLREDLAAGVVQGAQIGDILRDSWDDSEDPRVRVACFPTLADFADRVLGALEVLGAFAPVSIAKLCEQELHRMLAGISDSLYDAVRTAERSHPASMKKAAHSALTAMPHLGEDQSAQRGRQAIGLLGARMASTWLDAVVPLLSETLSMEIFGAEQSFRSSVDPQQDLRAWIESQVGTWKTAEEERSRAEAEGEAGPAAETGPPTAASPGLHAS